MAEIKGYGYQELQVLTSMVGVVPGHVLTVHGDSETYNLRLNEGSLVLTTESDAYRMRSLRKTVGERRWSMKI